MPHPEIQHRGAARCSLILAALSLVGCVHYDSGRYATNAPLNPGQVVVMPIDAKLRGKPDWIGVVRTVLPQGSTVRLEVASADGRYWRVNSQEGHGWLDSDDLRWVEVP